MSLDTMANIRGSEFNKKQKMKGNTTAQLEVESRRMEERLRVLKQMMSAEKARREVEGGYLWESGQKGPLLRRHKDQSPASTIKTTAVTNSNGGQRLRNKEKIKVKILTDKNETNSLTSEVLRCGQCDKSTASLSCVECVENYCQLCYAKFHQKGALALHHAKPVISKSKVRKISPQKQTTSTVEASSKTILSTATNDSGQSPSSKPNENSLLSGTYDEEESAASFQQALAEWRAAGNTTNAAQAYTAKDSSMSSMSSAGIQAGGTMAVGKGRPQIQFSGKSGVSYFEQLMMKRHRYDPMFLSRAAHVHSIPGSSGEDISSESINDRDLPTNESTPSKYNIFYDPELVESKPSSEETENCVDNSHASVSGSGVEIVELNIGQSISSARPTDVNIQPVELEQNSVKPVAKAGKSNESRRPKSTSKKRMQSSRSKTKSKPCKSANLGCSSPKVSESDIQASVKKSWTKCSEQAQLAQFFLHGVENDNKVITGIGSQHDDSEYKVAAKVCNSKLSSTIWLPGNSIWSTAANQDSDINPATDLPPVTSPPKSHNQSASTAAATIYSKVPVSESDDEDLNELELSVSNIEEGDIWEHQERDEEDDEALESLAWELASTVECEGRLTRCESEMDKLDEEIATNGVSSPPIPCPHQEGEGEVFILSDLSKVMSDFELYQQNVMEQDSD